MTQEYLEPQILLKLYSSPLSGETTPAGATCSEIFLDQTQDDCRLNLKGNDGCIIS
ncbi:hypothetical protein DPMN_089120 [Dreissena polymorpha]|uniref:Uncharacterized protein n=1 Tax=Dreissena polymorpha TaxID=45954 RepID=A0A9D4KW81_DREPO|nr:hypothetical protein DPMN_089120 [Dreissena polymorpha]